MTNINWDEALAADDSDASSNEPVPPGDYRVKVNKAEATVAKTGSPMIKVTLEIVGGPHNTRWVWTNFVVKPDNPDSAKMFVRKIKSFGFTSDYLANNKPSMDALAKALVGREAIATVSISEYQGSKRNDISKLKTVTGTGGMSAAVPPPAAPTSGVPSVPPAPTAPVIPPSLAADQGSDPF